MSAKHSKNFLLLFITAGIWGVAFVAQSVAMDYVGPYTFNMVRSFLGGAVLIPCIFFLSRLNNRQTDTTSSPVPKDLPKDLIIGGGMCGFLLFISTSLQQVGIMYTTVGKAGFITALYIILVPILGIFLGRMPEKKIWLCIVIALAGLYLLCMKDSFSLSKGDFLILICSVCFSIHIMVIDHFTEKVSGTKLSCIQFFVCSLFPPFQCSFLKSRIGKIFSLPGFLLFLQVSSPAVLPILSRSLARKEQILLLPL